MLSVELALDKVLTHARPLAAQRVPLAEAVGRVLAEEVTSDVDSPPHDKSIVDGYALRFADLAAGKAELSLLEQVVAGSLPTQPVRPGTATRLMTGAPVPDGADTIVMVERTEMLGDAGPVRIDDPKLVAGQNIMRRASSIRHGETVLERGRRLRPIEIGLLAEVGHVDVLAVRRPRVAVLSTGNELVAANMSPGAGQIRNSNEPMLVACALEAGAVPIPLGIARDEPGDLRARIAEGLSADVLVLSGGVSAGVLDLVPGVLAGLGVEQVFHKVRLKPGKPLWFGVLPGEQKRLVFGLPGNPVSSYVCWELFVRPAIQLLAGSRATPLERISGLLAAEYRQRGERATYHPSVVRHGPQGISIEPLAWRGSADLRCLAAANALACFPPGERTFSPGDTIEAVSIGHAD